MSINKVVVTGNLTRDPELRQTAGGMPILALGVAVNDRRKDPQTGEWRDFPNYIDCTMFGARAEAVAKYLAKGSKVAVEGKLRWSQWERDGEKRSKVEVVVDEIEFMSRGQQPQQPQAQPQQTAYAQPQAYRSAGGAQPQYAQQLGASVYDEEIPF